VAFFDSQTVKASAHGAKRGFDGGKKTVGRKRHVAVETDGRLLMVNLTPADISVRWPPDFGQGDKLISL